MAGKGKELLIVIYVINGILDLIDTGENTACECDFETRRASKENPEGCFSGNCPNWEYCTEIYHRHKKAEEYRGLLEGLKKELRE